MERYLSILRGLAGEAEPIVFGLAETSIHTIIFEDLPEKGDMTAFSYGLSLGEKPEWKYGRPELSICVRSTDKSWAWSLADIINRFSPNHTFSVGHILNFGEQIAEESRIKHFLIYYCTVLDQADARIPLGNFDINLVQLYPIYEEEIPIIQKIGAPTFMKGVGDAIYDPRRTSFVN